MRIILAALATFGAISFFSATANAQTIYSPWCAIYSDRSGATNCGFENLAQCRATVSGIGGYCQPNPFFVEYGRYGERRGRPARQAFQNY